MEQQHEQKLSVDDLLREAEAESIALVAAARTDGFVEKNGRYLRLNHTPTGPMLEEATNFVFQNVRFVSKDRGLLADVVVNHKRVAKSILFDKNSLTSTDVFRKKLPAEAL